MGYASLIQGSGSHKDALAERDGYLVTVYYTNRLVLGGVCTLNEAFYVLLYCQSFFPHFYLQVAIWTCAPVFMLKQYINAVQLVNSARIIAEHDAKEISKRS